MTNMTKKALGESLLRLLQKKAFDDITVKDIADDAGVNRQTFYYHFHDVYALMEWVVGLGIQGQVHTDNWREDLGGAFDYLRDNKSLVFNLYHSISREVLENYLQQTIQPGIHYYLYHMCEPGDLPKEDMDFIEHFLALAGGALLLDWVKNGMKDSPEHILEQLDRIILQNLQKLIREVGTKNASGLPEPPISGEKQPENSDKLQKM